MKRCGGQTEERIECKRAFEALKAHYAEVASDDFETIKRFEEFYHKRFGNVAEDSIGDCHHHHRQDEHKKDEEKVVDCEKKMTEAHPEYQGEIPEIFDSLKSGEVVLDLGSGHGFDCFIAEKKVGTNGRVIGVDMTPAMVHRSRRNAVEMGLKNVEFRLGEIEHLPVADSSIDVIISNRVIHGVPEKNKPQVFIDAFRALKPNGRFLMADILCPFELDSDTIREAIITRCHMVIAPTVVENMEKYMKDAGFVDIKIRPKEDGKTFITQKSEGKGCEDFVVTAFIQARKP